MVAFALILDYGATASSNYYKYNFCYSITTTTSIERPLFQDSLDKPALKMQNHSGF